MRLYFSAYEPDKPIRMVVRREMAPRISIVSLITIAVTSAGCAAATYGLMFGKLGHSPGVNLGPSDVNSLTRAAISPGNANGRVETPEPAQLCQRDIARLLKGVHLPLTPCDVRADEAIVAFRGHPAGSTCPVSPIDETAEQNKAPVS